MPSLSDRLELTILSKYRQATNIYGSEIRLSDLAAGQELGLSLVNAYTCRRLEDAYGTAKQDFMQYCDRQLYEKQKFSGLLLFDSTIVKIRNVRDEAYLAYKRSQAKANERKISFEAVFQRLCNIYHPTQSQIEVLAEDLKVRCTAYIQQCWREYLQESTEVTAICEGHFSAAERNPVSLDYSSYLFDRGMKPPFWGICGKVDAILLALSRTVRAESELLEHIARDTEESLAQHKQGSAWTPLREWEEMSTNMPQTQPCWEVEEGMAGADWGFVQSQCTLMQVVGDTKEALGEYQQDFDWTPSAVWEERSPKMEQLLPYCLELGGMARAT